jgi:uncharacterized membrane protein
VTDTAAPIATSTRVAADTEETAEKAERTFSISLLVSAVRCTLTYVLIPWVFPILGVASGVGPVVGVVIGTAAIAANLVSISRFHRADHRWKWPMTAINGGIIVLLVILVVVDATNL